MLNLSLSLTIPICVQYIETNWGVSNTVLREGWIDGGERIGSLSLFDQWLKPVGFTLILKPNGSALALCRSIYK